MVLIVVGLLLLPRVVVVVVVGVLNCTIAHRRAMRSLCRLHACDCMCLHISLCSYINILRWHALHCFLLQRGNLRLFSASARLCHEDNYCDMFMEVARARLRASQNCTLHSVQHLVTDMR